MSAFFGQGIELGSERMLRTRARSVVFDSLWSHGLEPTRLLCPLDFPDKNTGEGCHFLLQGIFPNQGSNLWLLRCRWILCLLSPQTELNKTLSSASPWPQMNIIRCDRCHGNPRKGDKDGQLHGNDCGSLILCLAHSAPGTVGYPAGEEGCQGLACPLLAWGEQPIRTVEAVDTTGARAFGSGTSEGAASGLPTSLSTQMTFPPSAGWPSPPSSSWCCWIWPTLNVVFQNKTTVF